MRYKEWSLRSRLLKTLLWPLFALVVLSAIVNYRAAVEISNTAYDNALGSTTLALVTRLERVDGDEKIEIDLPPAADEILRSDPLDKVLYLVVHGNEKVIAGDSVLLDIDRPIKSNHLKIDTTYIDGREFRTASYLYESATLNAYVIVAETLLKREQATGQIITGMLWPSLLQLFVVLLLTYFGVRVSLKPLEKLSQLIAAKNSQDLSPLPENVAPLEAYSLVKAINQLLNHLDKAGQAQQNFLSNAAHQLRTPLAGLQTQVELLINCIPDTLTPRVTKLADSAQRLSHALNQMLVLARTSAKGCLVHEKQQVNLAELVEETASDWLDIALKDDIDLGVEVSSVTVFGSHWMLREALSNLLENAIKYGKAGGKVTVRCGKKEAGDIYLEVEDEGDGIAPKEQQRICERFYRPAHTLKEGSGLGLSIVKEVADRHSADIHFIHDTSQKVFRICLLFNQKNVQQSASPLP